MATIWTIIVKWIWIIMNHTWSCSNTDAAGSDELRRGEEDHLGCLRGDVATQTWVIPCSLRRLAAFGWQDVTVDFCLPFLKSRKPATTNNCYLDLELVSHVHKSYSPIGTSKYPSKMPFFDMRFIHIIPCPTTVQPQPASFAKNLPESPSAKGTLACGVKLQRSTCAIDQLWIICKISMWHHHGTNQLSTCNC